MTALNKLAQLKGLAQVGYVTTDLSRAIAIFRLNYGIDRWFETGAATFVTEGGGRMTVKVALASVGGIQFEVIEPIDGDVDIYQRELPADGSFAIRFHHLGFSVRNGGDLAERRAASLETGHPIVFAASVGGTHFYYADARTRLGHHLEYIDFAPGMSSAIPVH